MKPEGVCGCEYLVGEVICGQSPQNAKRATGKGSGPRRARAEEARAAPLAAPSALPKAGMAYLAYLIFRDVGIPITVFRSRYSDHPGTHSHAGSDHRSGLLRRSCHLRPSASQIRDSEGRLQYSCILSSLCERTEGRYGRYSTLAII